MKINNLFLDFYLHKIQFCFFNKFLINYFTKMYNYILTYCFYSIILNFKLMSNSLANHKRIVLLSATLFAATLLLFGALSFNGINAQSLEKITISLNNATFGPLTSNPSLNQVKLLIDYQTKDLSLVDSTINGKMQVYAPNGTLIKTSSYPNGFTITDGGIIQFATSFADPALTNVKTNVTLTDLNKTETLSNTLSSDVALTL